MKYCSECGKPLTEGAKFCSECGARVQEAAVQESRSGSNGVFEEPKRETAAVYEKKEKTAPGKARVDFDWSEFNDEPHKRDIPDIKSPWATTGGIDEKELYAEMTPSTDRSRTMSFIDVLKAEKEEREKKAEERAFVYTDVIEVEADMSSFNDAPTLHYAPIYEDVEEPVKTPFDDIERKPERRAFDNTREPSIRTSRETIAEFDEYVKSFEAGAGIIHDEPRFEEPAPARPVNDEPKFELPDFLKRAVAPSKEEPVFRAAPEEAVSLEELSGSDHIDFRKDVIDEPTFEVPRIEETEEEPVFEEPKYEEPVFEEPKYDGDDFEDDFDEYLDLDTGRDEKPFEKDEEPIDEKALFKEMEEARPAKSGMTIAAPADKEEDVEALKKKLMELTGMDVKLTEIKPDGDEEEPAKPEELSLEPETTDDVEKVFDGLTAASEIRKEAAPAAETSPEDIYLGMHEAAPVSAVSDEEPELLVLEDTEPAPKAEPAAAAKQEPVTFVEEAEEDAVLVLEEYKPAHEPAPAAVVPEPAPVETPAAVEEVKPEPAPAPAVPEEVKAAPAPTETPASAPAAAEEASPEPAPVETPAAVEEVKPEDAPAPAAAEAPAKAEEPKKAKSSDALSLEELEKDLFGESPTAEAEAEETKKIDKFYTLYKKNEEFQKLLDEEYDKLKGDGAGKDAKPAAANADAKGDGLKATTTGEVPAEQSKVYRQIEDETIYKEFEIPPELGKAPPKEVDAAAAKAAAVPAAPPAPKAPAEAGSVTADKKDDKKADKAAAKAEKARLKEEKKALKAKAKAAAASAGAEYEEVDTGSGFLTVLAVIIAVILVILLAIILILQVAPDSGIAIAIDSLIENLTGSIGAADPWNGQFLL